MSERVTLTNRDGVRVFVSRADVERFAQHGFTEPKVEKPKAPATRKRAPKKATEETTESE